MNLVQPQIIWTWRLILRSRNVLAIYELPSSNEDQMEFRYKHWCGRAEQGRTRAPPCRRYSGGTSYGAGGPVMARRNWSPMRPDHNPQPGPQSPTRTIITSALSCGCWSGGPISLGILVPRTKIPARPK